jgi:transcriptional regulator with XRE-family HTH domain
MGMSLDDPVSFGKALRLLRSRRHLTQTVVAETAGITKAMLSAYERGTHLPSLPSLAPVLNVLHGDLHDLQDVLDEVEGLPPRRRSDRR